MKKIKTKKYLKIKTINLVLKLHKNLIKNQKIYAN